MRQSPCRPHFKWTRLYLTPLLAAAGLLSSAVTAQEVQSDSRLFFDAVDVRVVNVEAVVTDENGDPVSGLTASDFTILEDGEPLEITNFFAVEGSEIVGSEDADLGLDAIPEQAVGGPETRNLNLVMLVDSLHTDPRNRNQIFADLRDFLTRLEPEDRILIVNLGDELTIETSFTNDVDEILAVLSRLEGETGPSLRNDVAMRQILRGIQSTILPSAGGGGFASNQNDGPQATQSAENYLNQIRAFGESRAARSRAAIQVMQGFAGSLAGMPGRKALLYVSDGMSLRPVDGLLEAWQTKFSDWLFQNGGSQLVSRGIAISSDIGSLSRDLDELGRFAAANKIAIYPISPGSRTITSSVSAESAGTFNTGSSSGASTARTLEQSALEESLLRMADETGGVAFTRTANVEGLVQQIRRDFTSFYSLGFNPGSGDADPRDLEIQVSNPAWNVRYAKSAVDKDPLDQLKDRILSSLTYEVVDNPLEIELAPMEQIAGEDGNIQLSMMVKIPFQKILLLPEKDVHAGRLTLFVIVRDETNKGTSPFQQVEIPLQIANDQILQVMTQSAGYPLTINVEPGPKRIAIGVRDRLAQVDSTLFYDLEVGASASADGTTSP